MNKKASITVNNRPIKTFTFSGGEVYVSIEGIELGGIVEVVAYLRNANDIMQLLMTVNAIDMVGLRSINLTIPYFPYARQDRVCSEGESFSAMVMARLINGLECNKVVVLDPHSDKVVELVHRCTPVTQADLLEGSVVASDIKHKGLTLVAPDKGAAEKTTAVAERLGAEAIYCTKTRDVKTGAITGTEIPDGVSGKDFIIIDDICDGGRTFIELAKALKSKGAGDLYLYVTHGIFSHGLVPLKEPFKHVYCYHAFTNKPSDFLTIIKETDYED